MVRSQSSSYSSGSGSGSGSGSSSSQSSSSSGSGSGSSSGSGSGSGSYSSSSAPPVKKIGNAKRPLTKAALCREAGRKCCCVPPPPVPPCPKLQRPPCFDRCDRVRVRCQPPRNPFDNYMNRCRKPCAHPYHPPCPRPVSDFMCPTPCATGCECGAVKQFNVCKAELERLRNDRWREQERQAILEEKKNQKWMEDRYRSQLKQWEKANDDCAQDLETRKDLLDQIRKQRQDIKKLREEGRQWRRFKYRLMKEHKAEQQKLFAKQFVLREEELRVHQENLRVQQENKWLDSQMMERNSGNMTMPELEELRRMFAPVNRGYNETFEYFLVEPRPTNEELRQSAEQKMAALMGLRRKLCQCSCPCEAEEQKKTSVTLSLP